MKLFYESCATTHFIERWRCSWQKRQPLPSSTSLFTLKKEDSHEQHQNNAMPTLLSRIRSVPECLEKEHTGPTTIRTRLFWQTSELLRSGAHHNSKQGGATTSLSPPRTPKIWARHFQDHNGPWPRIRSIPECLAKEHDGGPTTILLIYCWVLCFYVYDAYRCFLQKVFILC
jgi:hypothetical protein